MWQTHKNSLLALGGLALILLASIVIVDEHEQAVVIRTGEPVRVVNKFQPDVPYGETGAGMVLRIPLIETVQRLDKRVLNLDMDPQEVLTSDQQRLRVDAYARFRIIAPVQTVRAAGSTDGVRTQLEPVLVSVLRQELGRRSFISLLTAERGDAMTNIRQKLDAQARRYGAQVIDVRIKRTDLPDGRPLESAFTRMATDRQREAEAIRAEGDRAARVIRAEADARAAAIYAESYGKDPDFYDFYRAMQSYDATFARADNRGESSIILSPDNEYLRQFRGGR
ncbi:protease modulator HflC [Leptolyngbya sp. 15MV]|nr:protease modulator HflC [Leptolyngbya sp. 15MV]